MTKVFKFTEPVQQGQKFQIGFPLPKGEYFLAQNLCLTDNYDERIKVNLKATMLWPDNSIKWLSCRGHATKALPINSEIFLVHLPQVSNKPRQHWVQDLSDFIVINTALGEVKISKLAPANMQYLNQLDTNLLIGIEQSDVKFDKLACEYTAIFSQDQAPLLCDIKQELNIKLRQAKTLKLSIKYCIYFDDAFVETSLALHNPMAVLSCDGKWDLGCENSLYIEKFGLAFNYETQKLRYKIKSKDAAKDCDSFHLLQYSSGGKNWNNVNHKNRHNIIPMQICGAQGEYQQANNTPIDIKCERPEPGITLSLNKRLIKHSAPNNEFADVNIIPQDFWQKFPSAISANCKSAQVDFAPKDSGIEVELQPGEIKSHRIFIGQYADQKVYQASSIVLNKDNLTKSQAFSLANSLQKRPQNHLLINVQQWFDKQEALDEFGWRNYGDLFADHEAAEYKGDGVFVSHYNNQYDPLYGFLNQWFLSGNPSYKTLADALFDHIVNIDIYHTKYDKPEYNKGLFWHTDHYVPAETAGHRTYSKHQASGVYMDHAGGGGPGPHHCYSSGLALYYLLSSNQEARQVTLQLCEWMQSIFEGDGTLLGLFLRIKNANYVKIPFSNKLLLGFGTGVIRNVFTNKYPLDRGSGNLVNVLLDSYLVSSKWHYIQQAEFVILNTISASDDIAMRHFEDIENTWFYTVFLQSVSKYLYLINQVLVAENKRGNRANLHIVLKIRAAFLHYTQWMSENEQPYLLSKDKLEYPNDTWTGQDLRKVQLLLCAHAISKDEKAKQKANELQDYIHKTLLQSDERTYTRIQALLMQNTIEEFVDEDMFSELSRLTKEDVSTDMITAYKKMNKSKFTRMLRFIRSYSISKELDLLCIRVPALKKAFKK